MACEEMVRNPYFVDKSDVLEEIITLGTEHNKYICITRPRRFGKTVIANMLAAFLSRANAGKKLFDSLKIHRSPICGRYQSRQQVIHISLDEMPPLCISGLYDRYPAHRQICKRVRA